MTAVKIMNADFSMMKFSSVKVKSDLYFIKAYIDKKDIVLKLPALRIPFDSRVNQFGVLEVNVSVGNKNEDLLIKLKELDDNIQKFSKELGWFEGEYKYLPFLKESDKFDPIVKLKISKTDENISTLFFDKQKNPLEVKTFDDVVELMKKGNYIESAIRCTGVWINKKNNTFGLSFKTDQILLKSVFVPEKDFEFNSDTDESTDTEILFSDSECE